MNYKCASILTLSLTLTLCACATKTPSASPSPSSSSNTSATATPSTTPSASPSATSKPTATIKSTPKTSAAPLVDCVGPDGKTAKMTQKACADFNKAWNKNTPTPTAATTAQVTGCGAYNPTGALGTARVSVKMESGQSWVGQGSLKFSQKYSECKGNGLDYGWQDVISSEMTRDFGGLRPGPYKVEVTYHGKNWSTDVNLNGGTSDVTITVSNN